MPQQQTYKGHTIVISGGNPTTLRIDNKPIDLVAEDNRFLTNNLPYQDYEEVMDLAKAVIDKVPNVNFLSGE